MSETRTEGTTVKRHCGAKHCQACVVIYGFTAAHFTSLPCGHRTCASAGHSEDWSDWWAANSSRATEPANA